MFVEDMVKSLRPTFWHTLYVLLCYIMYLLYHHSHIYMYVLYCICTVL